MSASASAKLRMERILRLQEQIDEIKSDIRDIYAKEKADGGDKTAMGAAVSYIRKRAKDRNAFDEREALAAVYISAFEASGTPLATHTHARDDRKARAKVRMSEAMDDNKALSAELLAAGLITEEAHANHIALSDAVARKLGAGVIDPVTGEITEQQIQAPKTRPEAVAKSAAHVDTSASGKGLAKEPLNADGSGGMQDEETIHPATNSNPQPTSSPEADTAGDAFPRASSATISPDPQLSGDDDGHRSIPSSPAVGAKSGEAATSSVDQGGDKPNARNRNGEQAVPVSGDDVPAFLKRKTPADYRPNCLKPDACGASGLTHCYACKKAMAESEVA